MTKENKQGLTQFPFYVDFFENIKVKNLKRKYGTKAILLLIYLYANIYNDKGYYIEVDKELIEEIDCEFKIKEFDFLEILNYLIDKNFFTLIRDNDKMIITSKGIQEQYSEIIKQEEKTVEVNKNYWLI